jgi:hypothetical protein
MGLVIVPMRWCGPVRPAERGEAAYQRLFLMDATPSLGQKDTSACLAPKAEDAELYYFAGELVDFSYNDPEP